MSSASRFSRIRIDTNVAREFGSLNSPAHSDADDSARRPLPSLLISPLPEESASRIHNHNANPKAKHEMRKLLSHVLMQLVNRKKPPAISDTIKEVGRDATEHGVASFIDVFKDVAKIGKAIQRSPTRSTADDEEEEEDSQTYSPEATFDLMLQLNDLLSMSLTQGWQIFEDELFLQDGLRSREEKATSILRRSRNSFSGRRSRSSSPTNQPQVHVPELLSLCISLLSSVISEDCRFQISSPRPSRPPNALQALSLAVAQLLIHTHRRDPKVISRIGFAVIPAFSTFQPEMHGRLIAFFETVVIRNVLESLRQVQGFSAIDNLAIMSPVAERQADGAPIVSIQIDEVQESSYQDTPSIKVQSSSAPHQEAAVYYLSSLVAPLMAAILEAVDLGALDNTHELSVRFYRLLDVISGLKVDAYNDLLAIVAYHTARSRKQACAILSSLWPKVIGHGSISRPLSIPLTPDWSRLPHMTSAKISHTTHQFVPWQFIHRAHWLNESIPQHACYACSKEIHDFGLLCPFCLCSVHFDCYDTPEGSLFLQYRMSGDSTILKVAMYRFSYLLPSRDVSTPMSIPKQHTFIPINLFTVCPCQLCCQPLWGGVTQGVKCTECSLIAHPTCLSSSSLPPCGMLDLTSDQLTLDIKALRRSAVNYFTELRWTYDHLAMLNYEEVMAIYDTLRTQLALLENGIALGSIVVIQHGKPASNVHDSRLEEFEMHRTLGWCKELLESQQLSRSTATADYMEENNLGHLEYSVLYDFSNLVYLSTAMKSPISTQSVNPISSADLLSVSNFDLAAESMNDPIAHPYEAVPLSHLREILNVEFNIHVPSVVKVLLTHLHHLAFFERLESTHISFQETLADDSAICVFPLPLGLDLSTDVETLVTAVEVCLLDLDLSVNEFAFLLLVRRFWPNGLMSDYGLKRLTRSILAWIISEDDNLATILREYIAKQRPLPGVRPPLDVPTWPASRFVQRTTPDSTAVGNGRDYVQARRALLSRYAEPWLLSLYNQDTAGYESIVYDACVELGEDRTSGIQVFEGQSNKTSSEFLNEVLYCITKVNQSSIAFSAIDGLILRWLRLVTDSCKGDIAIPGLHRVFPKDLESTGPISVAMSSEQPSSPRNGPPSSAGHGPFRILIDAASQSEVDLNQALNWLLMVARSGIELPTEVLERFSILVNSYPSNLDNAQLFVHTLLLSFWLKSLGRQNMQILFSRLFSKFEATLNASLKGNDDALSETSFSIVRRSLAACSLIYGCDRPRMLEIGLITEQEIKELPSRRKLIARASNVVDPILIDSVILRAIGQWLSFNIPVITSYIAKFFHLFFSHSPLIAPYEVDNFILRNSSLVTDCAWRFYGVDKHDIDAIRSEFLLRALAVDSEPFQSIVDNGLDETLPWDQRLRTVNRIARILNDVTSPAFHVDGRQWRSAVAEVFSSFFALLWKDPQEEVRLSVRAFCTGLLPARLEAISQCWNEALAKSPMKDRTKLVAFLIQLRSHFPGWKLISWETLIETIVEFDYDAGPPDAVEPNAIQPSYLSETNPDMTHLVVSVLLLAISMLSDGLEIDSFSLLKIKVQLIKVLGFSDVAVIPLQDPNSFQVQYGDATGIPDVALPCLEHLVALVDSPHTIGLPLSVTNVHNESGNGTLNTLVGYIFVDIVFNLIVTLERLESLPVLSLKSMLEAAYIIVHKHDFEVHPARSMQPLLRKTLLRILELVSKNVNYEVRQLALTVVQAFLKTSFAILGSIIPSVLEHITELVLPYGISNQDALITQGRSLIHNILTSHSTNGLLAGLFKRQLKPNIFTVMKQVFESQDAVTDPFAEPLPAILLRDTLVRIADTDSSTMQNVIINLHSFFQLYHDNYSYELVIFSGQQITSIMRRLSDHLFDYVDSSPLLLILALLVEGNRKHIRELLSYVETCLRIALIRGLIGSECLIKLVNVTQPKILKHADATLGKVLTTLLEIMPDTLRMKARVLPSTLNAIIQTLSSGEIPVFPDEPEARFRLLMSNMVENASYFLDHHTWADGQTENDFDASISVARIVLQTLEQDPTNRQASAYQDVEVTYRLVNSTRSWIVLGVAALQEPGRKWPVILFQHMPSFMHSYIATMKPYTQGNSTLDIATTDFNHAYIAIKVWLMLAQQTSTSVAAGDAPIIRVWNDLWPIFDSILSALELEARDGLSSTLMILASTSVTDLFAFLQMIHAPITLDMNTHVEVMNRLKSAAGESSHLKFKRAARGAPEGSQEMSFASLVQQAAKELIATEKLRIAESRRTPARIG